MKRMLIGVMVVGLLVGAARGEEKSLLPARKGPFIIGADISWVPEDEAQGAEYFDKGVKKDIFAILKEHGFNYVRLRTFVDPKSPGGYAARREEAFCDLAHTIAMAKRAKAAGMGFFLDLHYSDNWADPGKQTKPAAWKDYPFDALCDEVHTYTVHSINALIEAGVRPDMVQIGNEVSNGMLWPEGKAQSHFDQFAELLKAGISGVKDVDPTIPIVLHHDKGRTNSIMRWWLDNLIARGVQFDVIGMSCYNQAKEGDWKQNFEDLAKRYPRYGLLVAEYSSRKRYVNDLMFELPDRKGLGTFIWEPTRHKEAIFDKDGRNAGGGEREPIIGKPVPPIAPSTRATALTTRRWDHGGRYDTNSYIDVYPDMAKAYAAGDAKEQHK